MMPFKYADRNYSNCKMTYKNRLTIVSDAWAPQVNGVVTTLENCIREAEQEGWQVTVIHPDNFRNFACPGYKDVIISLPFGIGDMITQSEPDHIHIAVEGPLGVAAVRWCKKHQRPYTTAYHTKWPEFLQHIYGVNPKITTKLLRWFHKGSTSVLTTTETMAEELRTMGITDRAVAWTRGVNADVFDNPRYEYNNSPDKVKLISVGRVSKEKNLDVFCSLNPDYYDLTVVGDGPYRAELEKKYPHVKFVGIKKGKDLAYEYRNADVMVFTSLADTFGLVMIEAMYMGTPVAGFTVTGPKDVIDQEITGYHHDNIELAIAEALACDRKKCSDFARHKWTWNNAWHIMRDNLV
jgi:glycosyltransferase involved in cell wall biosynthesis